MTGTTSSIDDLPASNDSEESGFGLLSFSGRFRTLHLTWFAFFLAFVVWFDYAPFASTIAEDLGLTSQQSKTIALCNVALTVPARIFIGMALDHWGPRRVFSALLMLAVIPNTIFALSSSFETLALSRLALSIVGAGFVVGIRLVSEWFPSSEVGTAEGIYGGWGNFGSAAAAMILPTIAGLFVDEGWRWSILGTGVLACIYGFVFLRSVTDTPEGQTYAKPAKVGAIQVTSRKDVFGLAALTVPPSLALVIVAWRVFDMGILSTGVFAATVSVIGALLALQLAAVRKVNQPILDGEIPAETFSLRTVAVLCAAYFAAFGSELAIVTMLPSFFASTWDLGPRMAGLAAASFAFMNLVARPAGGLFSDRLGSRKRTLSVLLSGTTIGYLALTTLGSSWPVFAAIGMCMICSFCVQASEGAVFAVVPLVNKPSGGQIAGIVGAYGNVGAIVFLTCSILAGTRATFILIAASTLVALLASKWLIEPTAGHREVDVDLNEVTDLTDSTNSIGSTTQDAGKDETPLAGATR